MEIYSLNEIKLKEVVYKIYIFMGFLILILCLM